MKDMRPKVEATEVTEATEAKPAEPKAKENFAPDLLAQIFERKTKIGRNALDGGEIIQRHKFEFVLNGADATPGIFEDEEGDYFDVLIGMRSLNSAEEIEALHGITDAAAAPLKLTRACLYSLNGTPLTPDQKDFIWEALGMKGRQLCMIAFQQIGSASQVALGKFQKSFSAI